MNRRSFIKGFAFSASGLLLVPNAFAAIRRRGSVAPKKQKITSTQAITYLINEDFEAGTQPSGWYKDASPEFNAASDPAPLVGNYSLRISSSSATERTGALLATEPGEVWVYFLYRPVTTVNYLRICVLETSGYVAQLTLSYETGGQVKLRCGTGSYKYSSAGLIADGTTYNIWMHYKAVAGNASEYALWVSVLGSAKPESPQISASDGIVSENIKYVTLGWATGSTATIVVDKLRAAATEIPDNPT